MKFTNSKTLLAVATTAVLGLGITGNAYAQAYALAYTNVNNLVVGGCTGVVGSNCEFISFQDTSKASATLNGATTTTGGTGIFNAPIAIAPGSTWPDGSAPISDSFAKEGPGTFLSYSWADANQPSRQSNGDAFTQAIAISESNIHPDGTADAFAENSSQSAFQIRFQVTSPTTISFAFDADIWLQASLDALSAVPGSSALARFAHRIAINNALTGALVFEWNPNGDCASGSACNIGGGQAITGGTETLDTWNLTSQFNTLIPGTNLTYDGNAPATGSFADGVTGGFAAFSNVLADGFYNLSFSGETLTNVSRRSIPEPSVLGLLGLGLAGLGVSRIRRRATKKA